MKKLFLFMLAFSCALSVFAQKRNAGNNAQSIDVQETGGIAITPMGINSNESSDTQVLTEKSNQELPKENVREIFVENGQGTLKEQYTKSAPSAKTKRDVEFETYMIASAYGNFGVLLKMDKLKDFLDSSRTLTIDSSKIEDALESNPIELETGIGGAFNLGFILNRKLVFDLLFAADNHSRFFPLFDGRLVHTSVAIVFEPTLKFRLIGSDGFLDFSLGLGYKLTAFVNQTTIYKIDILEGSYKKSSSDIFNGLVIPFDTYFKLGNFLTVVGFDAVVSAKDLKNVYPEFDLRVGFGVVF